MIRRIADYLRELRIARLSAQVKSGMEYDAAPWERELARFAWKEMVKEINSRSPEQVARMEKRMGIG